MNEIALRSDIGLTSLKDMIEFYGWEIMRLDPFMQDLAYGFGAFPNDSELSASEEELAGKLSTVIGIFDRIGWTDQKAQANRIMLRYKEGVRGDRMQVLIEELRDAYNEKAHQLKWYTVDSKNIGLHENATLELCGQDLRIELAGPQEELNLAGRAFSFGLSTSAVSHAMRSAEGSLQALANVLGATFPNSVVELQDWKCLSDKITSILNRPHQSSGRSPEESEKKRILGEILSQSEGFRVAWRNHVQHVRGKYEQDEARRVLFAVGHYLRALSNAI